MSHLVRSKDQSGWKADRDQETGVFTELAWTFLLPLEALAVDALRFRARAGGNLLTRSFRDPLRPPPGLEAAKKREGEAMASLLLVRFPDGSLEYHIPFRHVSVGDLVRARGSAWMVAAVEEPREERVVASVARTTAGADWPGPFDEIALHAPAA
jgi:hypothetical protein